MLKQCEADISNNKDIATHFWPNMMLNLLHGRSKEEALNNIEIPEIQKAVKLYITKYDNKYKNINIIINHTEDNATLDIINYLNTANPLNPVTIISNKLQHNKLQHNNILIDKFRKIKLINAKFTTTMLFNMAVSEIKLDNANGIFYIEDIIKPIKADIVKSYYNFLHTYDYDILINNWYAPIYIERPFILTENYNNNFLAHAIKEEKKMLKSSYIDNFENLFDISRAEAYSIKSFDVIRPE